MDILWKYNLSTDYLNKRKKVFSTLNLQEVAALKASENAEQVAQDFDRIYLKLLRLIKYSTAKNEAEKSEIETHTNNLIKKLLNYLRQKPLQNKIAYEQKAFFQDICVFVNFFVNDSYLSAVHNNIPRTSLWEFSEKSMWNQLFQVFYARNRWNEWICEWWSCSYWTILLYNFFNKLKEAWLDLKISFYRYKNLEDNVIEFPTQRHSWLIINFQWKDYMVDRDWIIYDTNKSIIRDLQPYIDISAKRNESENVKLFENFKYENRRQTDSIIFFDDMDSFIQHCSKYPEHYRFSCYAQNDENHVENIDFEFGDCTFWLKWVEYYIQDNDIHMNNLIKSIIKKTYIKQIGDKYEMVTDKDREMLKKYFNLIKWKVDLNKIHEKLISLWQRKSILVEDIDWKKSVKLIKN